MKLLNKKWSECFYDSSWSYWENFCSVTLLWRQFIPQKLKNLPKISLVRKIKVLNNPIGFLVILMVQDAGLIWEGPRETNLTFLWALLSQQHISNYFRSEINVKLIQITCKYKFGWPREIFKSKIIFLI